MNNTYLNLEYGVRKRCSRVLVVLLGWLLLAGGAGPARAGSCALPNGLVAHWAFNQMSGVTVEDQSSNRLGGTLSGGVWTNGAALYDGAVQFNGTNDALFVPSAGSPPPAQIANLPFGSIAIRFSYRFTGLGDVIPLFYFGETNTDWPDLHLVLEIGHGRDPANRRLYFTIFDAGFCFDSGTNLLPNTWYQFVAVVGTNGNTGYLNGRELVDRHYNLNSNASYTNFFTSVPAPNCLTMGYGRFSTDSNFAYGPVTISDVQIYNRPLSSSEIAQLHADCNDTGTFRIEPSVVYTNSGLMLRWASATNYTYSVYRSESPNATGWELLPAFANIAATPPFNQLPLPGAWLQSYYRIRATSQ